MPFLWVGCIQLNTFIIEIEDWNVTVTIFTKSTTTSIFQSFNDNPYLANKNHRGNVIILNLYIIFKTQLIKEEKEECVRQPIERVQSNF